MFEDEREAERGTKHVLYVVSFMDGTLLSVMKGYPEKLISTVLKKYEANHDNEICRS